MIAHRRDIESLITAASPITDAESSLDPLLESIGDVPFVLLGEATHGTAEFYRIRATLTRRLIQEKGFDAVAVEADWPDAYRVNRYIRGHGDDREPVAALGDFKRFPQWMWRNLQVVELVESLAQINSDREVDKQAGFYGLDLYSLHRSVEAVIQYLDRVDPPAARRARQRYGCLDHGIDDPQQYGYQASLGLRKDCEDEAVEQLLDLRRRAVDYTSNDGLLAEDEQFFAEQNALVVKHAETYYRQMFGGRANTWNLRDAHMHRTLDALHRHLKSQGRQGRIVVWAHNSHLGDARATSMGKRGEWNLGQLVRQKQGAERARLIGFTTFQGTVAAASDWDQPVEHMTVRPAIDDSIEALLHETKLDDFILPILGNDSVRSALSEALYERAIGVVYRPATEMQSHYFRAAVADQFDAVVHIDQSSAVKPLDLTPLWQPDRVPETYPHGT